MTCEAKVINQLIKEKFTLKTFKKKILFYDGT